MSAFWLDNPTYISSSSTTPFSSPHFNISSRLLTNLHSQTLFDAFAVQVLVIPRLITDGKRLLGPKGDICVNAPTGSGKTLAYAIPIVETLSVRTITRLSALVVVPTRELVYQVAKVFELCAKKSGVKIGTANGQTPFLEEQLSISGHSSLPNSIDKSTIDILISTPGRLVDHILHNPAFTLQHLEYLVLDEVDRLLNQSFSNWIDVMMNEIRYPKHLKNRATFSEVDEEILINGERFLNCEDVTRGDVQKVILSATITQDIGKLAQLKLRCPELFIVNSIGDDPMKTSERLSKKQKQVNAGGKNDPIFSLPSTLREYALSVLAEIKPLSLIQLLLQESLLTRTVIFTKSNDTAARLSALLSAFFGRHTSCGEINVGLYSAHVDNTKRKRILRQFSEGQMNLLVVTDILSRGLDLSLSSIHFSPVIVSYDAPPTSRVYVHRSGRTARAGRDGSVYTLIEKEEGRRFWWDVVAPINRGEAGVIEKISLTKIKDGGSTVEEVYHSVIENMKEN